MEKVVVIGAGYVGLVTATCLAKIGHDVTCTDVSEAKIALLNKGITTIYEPGMEEALQEGLERKHLHFTTDASVYESADIIFICVGTPEFADGSANLKYVREAALEIANRAKGGAYIVVKSTVPVGTNKKVEQYINCLRKDKEPIEVVSNPEFLSQGSAMKDTLQGSRIVLGVQSEAAEKMMCSLYAGFNQPFVITDIASAEMIKYAANDFLALKISFINDIANLCEKLGANVEDVALGMGMDKRIGSSFLKAGIGYGGSCFPKDTKALHWLAEDKGYVLRTVKAAIEVNEKQKYRLLQAAKNDVLNLRNKRVAVLGLTFKPETDDLRESPAIPNIQILLEEGAHVTVYDPVGMPNAGKILGEKVTYAQSVHEALKNAEICFIFTDWAEIKALRAIDFLTNMDEVNIYDGRNCYDLAEMRQHKNINYYSIGRPIVSHNIYQQVGN